MVDSMIIIGNSVRGCHLFSNLFLHMPPSPGFDELLLCNEHLLIFSLVLHLLFASQFFHLKTIMCVYVVCEFWPENEFSSAYILSSLF